MLLKNILFTVLILTLSAGLVYWIEAEKEVRILCSMFETGQTRANVERTLNTANLLEIDSRENVISSSSPFHLHSMSCTVSFNEMEQVTEAEFTRLIDLSGVLTVTGLILSLALFLFQLLLALGFPLGRFAWGGQHKTLPRKLRIGSVISAIIFVLITILLWKNLSGSFNFPILYPVLGVLFLISSYANFNSESVPEKLTGTPSAVLLYLCFLSLTIQ